MVPPVAGIPQGGAMGLLPDRLPDQLGALVDAAERQCEQLARLQESVRVLGARLEERESRDDYRWVLLPYLASAKLLVRGGYVSSNTAGLYWLTVGSGRVLPFYLFANGLWNLPFDSESKALVIAPGLAIAIEGAGTPVGALLVQNA